MGDQVLLLLLQILAAFGITLSLSRFLARMLLPSRAPVDNSPPGSCGLPLFGETFSFMAANNTTRGFYEFVRLRRSRYGKCFRTNIFGKTHVFVSSIEAAKLVLGHDSSFYRSYLRSISSLLGEHSVLCATDGYHKLLRTRIGGLFTTENLASFVKLFDKLAMDSLGRWKDQGTVVVFDEALKITFRAMCQMLMSLKDESELEELQKDVSSICEGMLAIPLKIPCTRYFRGLKARERFMRTLKTIIDERRRKGSAKDDDLLQSLVVEGTTSKASDLLTDDQIQDNILTLIIAGQITTASALAWMVKYLDENQHVQKKLRDLHLQIEAENSGSELGLQLLNASMSYASKVGKETLRMATIVSWFPMVAMEDSMIEGFEVKKGWIVNVDARYIHNDEAVYTDPAKFLPSRFDEEPKPYGYLAFGNGATTCLGKNLAKAMMVIFLHRLVTTYRWKVTDPDLSLQKGALFPRLRSGCPINVTPV